MLPYQNYNRLIKLAREMPHFLDQKRPKKVKEIYAALERDHPEMPAEEKARIAARQGKKGHQRQGPPYTAPITKESSGKPKKVYFYKNGKRRGYYPKPEGLKVPENHRWCQSTGKLVPCKRFRNRLK